MPVEPDDRISKNPRILIKALKSIGRKMKRALIKFFRYQGKIVIITIILIVIIGCVTWRTFVRTPDQEKIRRDYYVHDISQETGIDPKRIAAYSSAQLEIIDRLD
ncbi:MAG: hypothetical protein SCK70_02845, partial [bacterium]|nr:hypothetical protein [bacterium]